VSSLHASGISQTILIAILEAWGISGFRQHLRRVQDGYRQRRDLFLGFVEKHLKNYAEWSVPNAGMFVWLKLKGVQSTDLLIKTKAVEKKVLLVSGSCFMPSGEDSPFVRASYSTATDADMEEALRRLAQLLQEEAETSCEA
jgi:kynurenine/2-aminoadipate aminotransferase